MITISVAFPSPSLSLPCRLHGWFLFNPKSVTSQIKGNGISYKIFSHIMIGSSWQYLVPGRLELSSLQFWRWVSTICGGLAKKWTSDISGSKSSHRCFLQISKFSLFAIFRCGRFERKLFRPLPTQPLSIPTAPTAPIFRFSKKTNLIWSEGDGF